jgi:hypothetical protein
VQILKRFVFRQIMVVLLTTMVFAVLFSTHYSFAKEVECADTFIDMDWDPKNHEPNNPSFKEFELLAYHGSLCELTKCIDHEECTNRDAVDWEKFKSSPAYELSYEEQKKCLETSQDDGNGKDGLVGYEIMSCGLGENRY